MTPAQRARFYFPAWAAAAQAHGWQSQRSLLAAQRQECWASPDLNQIYQRIWSMAEEFARAEARATMADDFRHACHAVALGRDKSANDLSNDECERVVALFHLLANPDDLRALMAWSSPNEARRKRMLWWIRHNCVESYVVAICREKFGVDEFRSLSFPQLSQLHMTLRNRRNARKASVPSVP
ncbi:MAG: hypothetical protein AB9869_01115 [Verrucomicrobiia bacterium]